MGTFLIQNAVISSDLKQEIGGRDEAFLSAPTSRQGHCYVSLHRLGCSASSLGVLMTDMEQDLSSVFPISVRGQYGNQVTDGNVFLLGILPIVGNNPVKAHRLNDHCFALTTLPGHWLTGTACHGIVRDRTGSLWLFQYGMVEGPAHEASINQLANYPIAEKMWDRMARNIGNRFRSDFAAGCQNSATAGVR